MKPSPGSRVVVLLTVVAAVAWPLSVQSPGAVSAAARGIAESGPAATVRYRLDASKSRFTVKAKVSGIFSAFGHDHTIAIRDFQGEAALAPENPAQASLQLTIRAASLEVTDKVSDKDRREIESTMRDKVLETSTYPEIVFRSTNITVDKTGEGQYQAKIWGDLTLHGVTRNGLIYAKVVITGDTLRAAGSFPLRQTDYKITPVSVAAGTVKVKDELSFSFDIVGNKT
jgi:polyisoprenoid-binding protein YceI